MEHFVSFCLGKLGEEIKMKLKKTKKGNERTKSKAKTNEKRKASILISHKLVNLVNLVMWVLLSIASITAFIPFISSSI